MTVILKHCLHTVPDHDCWQICLASMEFEDYFGSKYVFARNFQSVGFFFFFFSFYLFLLLLCYAEPGNFFLVPSYFIPCDRVCLGRLCITPGNFISVEMDVSQWPWHCKLVFYERFKQTTIRHRMVSLD